MTIVNKKKIKSTGKMFKEMHQRVKHWLKKLMPLVFKFHKKITYYLIAYDII